MGKIHCNLIIKSNRNRHSNTFNKFGKCKITISITEMALANMRRLYKIKNGIDVETVSRLRKKHKVIVREDISEIIESLIEESYMKYFQSWNVEEHKFFRDPLKRRKINISLRSGIIEKFDYMLNKKYGSSLGYRSKFISDWFESLF